MPGKELLSFGHWWAQSASTEHDIIVTEVHIPSPLYNDQHSDTDTETVGGLLIILCWKVIVK